MEMIYSLEEAARQAAVADGLVKGSGGSSPTSQSVSPGIAEEGMTSSENSIGGVTSSSSNSSSSNVPHLRTRTRSHGNGISADDEYVESKDSRHRTEQRRGKWTAEEEAYANKLIHEFKMGTLPLTDGTTLRTFLSKLLNCDPMRISKKFVGPSSLGKQVFRRRHHEIQPEEIDRSRKELSELEKKFLDRCPIYKSKSVSSSNGCEVAFEGQGEGGEGTTDIVRSSEDGKDGGGPVTSIWLGIKNENGTIDKDWSTVWDGAELEKAARKRGFDTLPKREKITRIRKARRVNELYDYNQGDDDDDDNIKQRTIKGGEMKSTKANSHAHEGKNGTKQKVNNGQQKKIASSQNINRGTYFSTNDMSESNYGDSVNKVICYNSHINPLLNPQSIHSGARPLSGLPSSSLSSGPGTAPSNADCGINISNNGVPRGQSQNPYTIGPDVVMPMIDMDSSSMHRSASLDMLCSLDVMRLPSVISMESMQSIYNQNSGAFPWLQQNNSYGDLQMTSIQGAGLSSTSLASASLGTSSSMGSIWPSMNNLAEAANLVENQAYPNSTVNAMRSAAFASTHPSLFQPTSYTSNGQDNGNGYNSSLHSHLNRNQRNSSSSISPSFLPTTSTSSLSAEPQNRLSSFDRLQSLSSAALNELLKQNERDKLKDFSQDNIDRTGSTNDAEEEVGYSLDASPSQRNPVTSKIKC